MRQALIAFAIFAALVGTTWARAATVDAAVTPLISTSTSECGGSCSGSTLAAGDTLSVTFNQSASVSIPWTLTLTDGTSLPITLSSNQVGALPVTSESGSTISFTVGAFPGAAPSLADLEILGSTGITANGVGWDLVASGQASKPYQVASCSEITTPTTFSRVFGGRNCDIGFGKAGPSIPDIFDEIAVPTSDLIGPPDDSAPEVITFCASSGGTDTAYDLATGAELGSAPCGTSNSNEGTLGNTSGPNLDYISTPTLASYEEVGVIETIPGSHYVSATGVGPELTSIDISGTTATMHFSAPVYCQAPGNDSSTAQSFHFASPWWSTNPASLVYGSSISCPGSSSPTTSITVSFPKPIPTTGVAFKYDKYGPQHNIVGASGTALAGEAEVSQSVYQGPLQGAPSISSFTGTGALASSGGTATLDYATTNAIQCAVSVTPSTGTAIQMPFAYLYEGNTPAAPLSSVAPCPASTGTVLASLPSNTGAQPVTYTFTLTAIGLASLNPGSASKQFSVTVAAASTPTTLPAPTTTTTTTVPSVTTSTIPPATTTTTTSTSPPAETVPITAAGAPDSTTTTTPKPVVLSSRTAIMKGLAPRVAKLMPDRGAPAGGARILIFGSHFTKRVTVRFGSHRASHVRVISSTELLAFCPTGRGIEYVTVHTARGTSARVHSARFVY